MDYNYYIKDVGVVDPALLAPITELIKDGPSGDVPRFNYKVNGIVTGQNAELDAAIWKVKASLVDTPDLRNNPWGNYHAIHWIAPGEKLHEHTDISNGDSFDDLWVHKVHVPLITNPQTMFGFRRNLNEQIEWLHLKQGHAYMYNNVVFHKVWNPGPISRAHLIMYAPDKVSIAHFSRTKLWKPHATTS